MDPEPARPVTAGSAVTGVLILMVAVGTLVYAIVAQALDSPLEPARTFMYWQALWNDGHYGVKYNFAVTWIAMLVALGGPPVLVALAVEAIRSSRDRPAFPSDWCPLQWPHMDRAARLRLALGLAGIAVLFGAVCILDASLLAPVGFLAQIVLLLWPFTVLGGAVLLLDELLPERVVVGAIEALGRAPRGQSEDLYIKLAGARFTVPAALWSRLTLADTIAVRTSGGLDRVRAVAVRP